MGTDLQPNQIAAAADFSQTIVARLADSRGVHAETAISAASRMAGTLLLQSSGLPLAKLAPGTPVFSDVINERGPSVLETVGRMLARLKVPFDPQRMTFDVPGEHRPHLGLMQIQKLLAGAFQAILEKHGLTTEEGAYAAAVSTASLIQQCARFLDPHVAYAIATYGIVEGCKTVPV